MMPRALERLGQPAADDQPEAEDAEHVQPQQRSTSVRCRTRQTSSLND